MFLEYGYSGTTFQEIADELNITKAPSLIILRNKFMIMETFIDDLFSQIKGYVDSFRKNIKPILASLHNLYLRLQKDNEHA